MLIIMSHSPSRIIFPELYVIRLYFAKWDIIVFPNIIRIIDRNTSVDNISVMISERIFCFINDLVSLTWYEALKASINELTPFVEKYNARINPNESNPPLGLFIISSIVLNVIVLVEGGNILAIRFINVSWNPIIGMYGISVKTTIIDGKNAKKKLKAREDARVVIEPFIIPFQKNKVTS